MRHVLTFAFEKSTKNTHRFSELDAGGAPADQTGAIVGSLYVKRSAFPTAEPPKSLTVTIESL